MQKAREEVHVLVGLSFLSNASGGWYSLLRQLQAIPPQLPVPLAAIFRPVKIRKAKERSVVRVGRTSPAYIADEEEHSRNVLLALGDLQRVRVAHDVH